MSVIIDQLVQERVIGGPFSVPASQRSTPDGKRSAARGRQNAAFYDDALPGDISGLQELVATLQAELQEARAELDRTHQDNAHLQAEYTTLWVCCGFLSYLVPTEWSILSHEVTPTLSHRTKCTTCATSTAPALSSFLLAPPVSP